MRAISSYLLPRTRVSFLASLVFWNPLLAAAITFVQGGTHHFLRNWLAATAMSEVVALQCYSGAYIVRRAELFVYRLRRQSAPAHGVGWYLLLATIMMPFALPLGFLTGGAAAHCLGFDWGT